MDDVHVVWKGGTGRKVISWVEWLFRRRAPLRTERDEMLQVW